MRCSLRRSAEPVLRSGDSEQIRAWSSSFLKRRLARQQKRWLRLRQAAPSEKQLTYGNLAKGVTSKTRSGVYRFHAILFPLQRRSGNTRDSQLLIVRRSGSVAPSECIGIFPVRTREESSATKAAKSPRRSIRRISGQELGNSQPSVCRERLRWSRGRSPLKRL